MSREIGGLRPGQGACRYEGYSLSDRFGELCRVCAAVFVAALSLSGAYAPAQARERVFYYHNDHLGTPQVMTDEGGKVVWSAEYEPFGMATVNEDPDGDGIRVTNNLRFPGQYYDAETGLHYNWHRYYDPGTGRYMQPDPIGLEGGLNPYSYVSGNPVNNTDSSGLIAGVDDLVIIGGLGILAGGATAYLQSPGGKAAVHGVIDNIRDRWDNLPPPLPPPLFCETREPSPPPDPELSPLEKCVAQCQLTSQSRAARIGCYISRCGLVLTTEILRGIRGMNR